MKEKRLHQTCILWCGTKAVLDPMKDIFAKQNQAIEAILNSEQALELILVVVEFSPLLRNAKPGRFFSPDRCAGIGGRIR